MEEIPSLPIGWASEKVNGEWLLLLLFLLHITLVLCTPYLRGAVECHSSCPEPEQTVWKHLVHSIFSASFPPELMWQLHSAGVRNFFTFVGSGR